MSHPHQAISLDLQNVLARGVTDAPQEEPWHHEIEDQIRRWRKHAKCMTDLHSDAGYYFKTRKLRYGLIPVIVPLIMAPLAPIITTEYGWGMYFNSLVLAVVGLFTGLIMFFSPGEKMQQHFSFSARYADIVSDIDAELIRYRQYRAAADVFTLKIKMMIDNLAFQEPVIPKSIVTGRTGYFGECGAFCCCVSQKKIPTKTATEASSDQLVETYLRRSIATRKSESPSNTDDQKL